MHAAIEPDIVDSGLPMIQHWCIIFSFKVRFTPVSRFVLLGLCVCACVCILCSGYLELCLSIGKCDAGLFNLYHSVF